MARRKKITEEQKETVALNTETKLEKVEQKETTMDEKTELVKPDIVPNVEPEKVPDLEIVTTGVKMYRVYADVEQPYKRTMFPEDKLYSLNPELGSLAVVYEWKTYYGKPSKWVAIEMYQLQCSGWELISAKA